MSDHRKRFFLLTKRAAVKTFVCVSTTLLTFLAVGYARWQVFQEDTIEPIRHRDSVSAELPQLDSVESYSTSNRCRSCHPSEYESWHDSYHRSMTQVANEQTVVGQFDGSETPVNGIGYKPFKVGHQFWADMPDPDIMMYVIQGVSKGTSKQVGPHRYLVKQSKNSPVKRVDLRAIDRVKQQVVMTTGSHHYQTYWVNSPRHDRLLQTLPLIYLIEDKRWIPREAAFMHPPETTHFITQWNHHCIQCHSTGGNPGLNENTGQLETRVAELGISCEACHGPGEEHIAHHQNLLNRYQAHWSKPSEPSIVNPAKLGHKRSSEVCGQCHGVFIRQGEDGMNYAKHGPSYRPGDDLHKARYYIQYPQPGSPPSRFEELQKNPDFFRERWWPDGTILAGGREYTAMSASACYQKGEISCTSCHSMHASDPNDQLKPEAFTSAACVKCHHEERYNENVSSHTHHRAASSGSNCLNCHMPHTTYALLNAIRSHQISSPNPTSSIEHGVPNACNLCHLDKTLAWTAQQFSDWYGYQSPPLTDDQRNIAASLLWMLTGDAAQRVVVAWHSGWQPAQQTSGTDWLVPFQAQLLSDPYGVVRYVAHRSLTAMENVESFSYDFLADRASLTSVVHEVVERWEKGRHKTLNATGNHVLLDSAGDVLQDELKRLLRLRDDRPVTIKE